MTYGPYGLFRVQSLPRKPINQSIDSEFPMNFVNGNHEKNCWWIPMNSQCPIRIYVDPWIPGVLPQVLRRVRHLGDKTVQQIMSFRRRQVAILIAPGGFNIFQPWNMMKKWRIHQGCTVRLVGGDWNHGLFWMTFRKYWECHHPNWRTHIFQDG